MAYQGRREKKGRRGGRKERGQRLQQTHAEELTYEEMLVSRESFLNLVRAAIKSVNTYSNGFMAGKSKGALEVLNSGMNLQVMFVQAGTEEKLKSGTDWDKETLNLGRNLANEFAENVRAQKRQVQESGRTPSKKVKGFFKRMETYADAIQTALIDPSKVSKPRTMRYVGPSGEALDRHLVESGGKTKSGASSIVSANHKREAMVEDVRANPETYAKRHEQIAKKRAKAPSQVDFIPNSAFNLDLDESLLEGSEDPALGGEDWPMSDLSQTHKKPRKSDLSRQHGQTATTGQPQKQWNW